MVGGYSPNTSEAMPLFRAFTTCCLLLLLLLLLEQGGALHMRMRVGSGLSTSNGSSGLSRSKSSSSSSGGRRRGDPEETDGGGKLRYIHKMAVDTSKSHPQKLLEFLTVALPNVKRTQAKAWLSHDAVVVNGEAQTRFDYDLYDGDIIIVRAGKVSPSGSSASSRVGGGVTVLFEDDDLIVVDKPYNMSLSKPSSSSSSSSLTTQDEAFLLPSINAYLGKKKQRALLVHQMDKESSGLALFAKNADAKAFLQKNWSSFGRSFICVCRGYLRPLQGSWTSYQDESVAEGRVECYTNKADFDNASNEVRLYTAISHYRTLETSKQGEPSSLVEVSLETNRRDQLRAQFAHRGHALRGETLYNQLDPMNAEGGEEAPVTNGGDSPRLRRKDSRLALHASEIRISHPRTREAVSFVSPLPPSFSLTLSPADGKGVGLPLMPSVPTPEAIDDGRDGDDDSTFPVRRQGVKVLSLDEFLGQMPTTRKR